MDRLKRIQSLIVILFASLTMQAQTYHDVIEKAMAYTMTDSLEQAEKLFEEALKMDPISARNALLFSNLGTVQKRMGKVDKAIESYSMALNITPYATPILLNRGALLLDKGLSNEAYIDFCNVIDLIPENVEARLYRAYIYMQRRMYEEAKIDYNVVVSKDSKHKSARIGLVLIDQNTGKMPSALNKLNLLINDFPKDASLFIMRANMELEQNFVDAAAVDLEEAISLEPNNTEILCQLGDVYLKLHKKVEARKSFEQAIKLGVPRSSLRGQLKACK